ncbi:MAG: hypothetical protein Q8R37_04675 [Nanoarchaeota archaeon]|nr:hypothetical protein [Nanoarchaeota archaeon]
MAEQHLIVDSLKFGYEGLFNTSELYHLISSWFYDKGWEWYEKVNQEQVTSSGRQITILLEPWRNISDYYKLIIRLKMNFIDVNEVEIEHRGKTIRMSQGVIRVTFDGYVISDRKEKWSKKPFSWFLGYVLERYFFYEHFSKAKNWLESDLHDLYTHIKNYVNSIKYTYQQ